MNITLSPVDATGSPPSSQSSRQRRAVSIIFAVALLASCATAPRGPASTLANAGMASSNALSRDHRSLASGIRDVAVLDAFSNTMGICANPDNCAPIPPPTSLRLEREQLAHAIELRGRAAEALANAYAALKIEADYDARGDLVSATNGAIDSVNSFSAALMAVSGASAAPGASLISQPLKAIVGFGAGRIAERAQAKRLRKASIAISEATRRLRDALSVEAYVFNDLSGYVVETRVSAKKSLLQAGLASHQSIVTPLIDSLQLKPADGIESTIRKSPATQTAVQAIIDEQARAEVAQIKARYAASLKTLDELLKAHAAFERKESISLAELDRFLGELNAATSPPK